MINADHEEGGFTSALGRHVRRHRRAVIGATGLAAVLGAGAFLVTDQVTKDSPTSAGPLSPVTTVPAGVSEEPAAETGLARPASTGQAPAAQVAAGPTTGPQTLQERVDAARTANKRLGTEVRHQSPMKATEVDPAKVHVEQSGSDRAGKMLRVSSAHQDLTGYRELAWVRDGKAVGDADCTKKITLSPQSPARARPTLLICWRLSAKKSVYTVAVDFKTPPPESVSVAALDRAWRAMR
jgi:hypothetical protein